MPKIFPFKGIYFNPSTSGNLSDLISPPYDVIGPEEAERLKNKSPYNFSRVILPMEEHDDYSRAAGLLHRWRTLSILAQDPSPHFYLYCQSFTWSGKKHERCTLMTSVELSDFSKGEIRPHENTHGKYKADRLQILRKTQCNLSHIFAMVKDEEGTLQTAYEKIMFNTPFLNAQADDGVQHRVWKITAAEGASIQSFFAERPIYIVDGHHRYESSLMYAREMGAVGHLKHPASQMLFAIANSLDPALLVFPTHRRVKNIGPETLKKSELEKRFHLVPAQFSEVRQFTETASLEPRFGMYAWGELYMVAPRSEAASQVDFKKSVSQLAVAWSDDGLLRDFLKIQEGERSQKITYERDAEALWSKKDPLDLIIFHAPPLIETITAVSDENGFMPQKSTYFYPKLAAGLVMRDVSGLS